MTFSSYIFREEQWHRKGSMERNQGKRKKGKKIHLTEKDGDLAHEHPKNTYKNAY